jgi:hypothetical protein
VIPVADNNADELAILIKDEFDLPVTDTFITGVHRGVRRRRVRRAVTAGGALAATAGVAAVVVTLVGPTQLVNPSSSTTGSIAAVPPTAAPESVHPPLDGYRVTFVPDGLRIGVHGDGAATYPVSEDQLHNDDRLAPTAEHPTARTTLSTYVRPNGSNWLWISVLRPERTTAQVDRAQVTEWLTGWSVKGTEVIERYGLPAGRAQLTSTVGVEATVHSVVITTPDGVVINVSGNAAVPVADLKAVAAGILAP